MIPSRKWKRPPTEWEKTRANHIPDKGLVSSIQKELLHLNSKNINNNLQRAKDLNRHFSPQKTTLRKKSKIWKPDFLILKITPKP